MHTRTHTLLEDRDQEKPKPIIKPKKKIARFFFFFFNVACFNVAATLNQSSLTEVINFFMDTRK